MNKRPLPVTVLGWLFVAFGVISGLAALFAMTGLVGPETAPRARVNEFLPMVVVQALAAVGGALVLRGSSVGRWLLIAWMAYHVVLSGFHEPMELLVHGVMLAVVAYLLFRGEAG